MPCWTSRGCPPRSSGERGGGVLPSPGSGWEPAGGALGPRGILYASPGKKRVPAGLLSEQSCLLTPFHVVLPPPRPICSAIDKLDKEPWDFVRREMVVDKGLEEGVADAIRPFVELRGQPQALLAKLLDKGAWSQGGMWILPALGPVSCLLLLCEVARVAALVESPTKRLPRFSNTQTNPQATRLPATRAPAPRWRSCARCLGTWRAWARSPTSSSTCPWRGAWTTTLASSTRRC